MKNLLILLLLFPVLLSAQDIITLTDGSEIESKVTEVTDKQIKYKKFSNLDGPVYNIEKSKVFTIKYENGEKDIFTKIEAAPPSAPVVSDDNIDKLTIISEGFGTDYFHGNTEVSHTEFQTIMKNGNESAYKRYKIGKNSNIAGQVFMYPSAGVLGYFIGTSIGEKKVSDNSAIGLTAGGTGVVVGIILFVYGNNSKKHAVKQYNSKITSTGFRINASENGIGLSYNF